MSRAALREMDAAIADAFAKAGLADAAVHRSRVDGAETACTVLIDEDFINTDEGMVRLGTQETALTLYRAEVEAAVNDSVTITETGAVYRLQSVLSRDQSAVQWRAVPARAEDQP